MDNRQQGNLSGETLTGAPPAPQEVKIRTMRSDLASMAASGGGLPQFQNVRIAHEPQGASSNSNLISLVVAIVAALILIVAGYFGYAAVKQHDAAESTGVTGVKAQ